MQADYDTLVKTNQKLEEQLNDSSQQINDLITELTNQKNAQKSDRSTLQEEHTKQIQELQEQLQSAQAKNSELQEQLQFAVSQAQDFQSQLDAKQSSDSQEVTTLKSEKISLSREIQELYEQLEASDNQVQELKNVLNAQQEEQSQQVISLKSEKMKLADEKAKLKEQLKDASQQLEDLITDVSQKHQLENEYNSLKKERQELNAKLQASESQNDEFRTALTNAAEQVKSLKEQLQDTKSSSINPDELDAVRSQLEEAAEENEDLRSELENALEQNEELRSALDTLSTQSAQQRSELQEKLHTTEQQFAVLQTENKKLHQTLDEYKSRMNAKRENSGAAYLQVASSVEALNKQENTRFVHINFSNDGDLILEHSKNPETAEIALLRNGAMIPNPHFYPDLTGKGENGEALEILLPVFEMPELDDDKNYPVKNLMPALGEIRDRALHVKRKGKIEV